MARIQAADRASWLECLAPGRCGSILPVVFGIESAFLERFLTKSVTCTLIRASSGCGCCRI